MTVSLFFSKQSPQLDDDPVTRMPMPNVFVVPPEEDQSPTWCFFDANQPALSHVMEPPESPTISVFNSPIDEDTPEHRRNHPELFEISDVPRRSDDQLRSVVDALTNDDDLDTGFDTESEYEGDAEIMDVEPCLAHGSSRHAIRTFRNVADDSDVVEVVKVRRSRLSDEMETGEQILPPVSEGKRPNTLKSRASKAFRSLRGSLRTSKSRAQDIFPLPPPRSSSQVRQGSLEETQPPDAFARSRTPTISRRSSILSQLFAPSSLKSQCSVSSFDDSQPVSSGSTNSLHHASTSTQENVVSSPTSAVFSTRSSIYHSSGLDEARLQATSPTPTTASTRSSSRRFSMLNLQRLFSFSSATTRPTPASSVNPTSSIGSDHTTLRSSSRTSPSATSSISTTSGPQTPTSTEEVIPEELITQGKRRTSVFDGFESAFETKKGLNLDIGFAFASDGGSQPQIPQSFPSPSGTIRPRSFQLVTAKHQSGGENHPQTPTNRQHLALDDDEADMSLEMRLDSLHFESLSFDADQFNIPAS